jgi:GNAT superfamily N-acetyltransferase
MPDDPFEIETDPHRRDVQALDVWMYQLNVARTGIADGEELAIFVRDDDGAIRAGLYGWTWSGWLEVRALWVHEAERGRGLGSRLLAAAEEEARRRGAHTVILETHSFQAPAFYQQRGYQVYAELEGYPTGHSKLFLRKPLRAPEQSEE